MLLVRCPFAAHPGGEEADLGGDEQHRGVSPGVQVLHGGHRRAEQLPAVSVAGGGAVRGMARPETRAFNTSPLGDKRGFFAEYFVCRLAHGWAWHAEV